MTLDLKAYPIWLNGKTPATSDLSPLAFAGFAHFTAMQIRSRKVKALDLHLDRLRNASIEFFGRAVPEAQLLAHLKMVIDNGPEDQSVTVTIFSMAGEFSPDVAKAELGVLVRGAPPSNGPNGPLKLLPVRHERAFASIKHVGESSKTYYLQQALKQGFNDAAFVDRFGRLSEATIWNLAFWDGSAVVWPKAEMLTGTMMGTVQRQLAKLGIEQKTQEIRLDELKGYSGAVVMNSWTPAIAVAAIGDHSFGQSEALKELLHKAYELEPATGL